MYSENNVTNDQKFKRFVKNIKLGRRLGACNDYQCMQTYMAYHKIKTKS